MNRSLAYRREAWLAWEKLRIVYNVTLLAVGLPGLYFLWCFEEYVGQSRGFIMGWAVPTIVFGVVANICYCLGPLAEVAAYWVLGWRMGKARCLLFAPGLLFTMGWLFAFLRRLFYHLAGYLR